MILGVSMATSVSVSYVLFVEEFVLAVLMKLDPGVLLDDVIDDESDSSFIDDVAPAFGSS